MFGWLKKGLSEFTDWYAHHGYPKLSRLHGEGSSSWSGESVSEATALNHSVVWACKRRISECVAMLPLLMTQKTDKGKSPAIKHPMFGALKMSPNSEQSAMTFRETLTGHCLMRGNLYAQILRRSGTYEANELWPLTPDDVTPDREKSGQKRLVYIVKEGNASSKTYTVSSEKPQDILHVPGLGFNGVCGYSVVTMARQSFGSALATERNVARFWANGGRLPYNLKLAQKFKDDAAADKFRNDWEKLYADPHRAPILEPWLTYEKTGISMADAQMLESRTFSVSDICRWFLLSPHLAGDLSRATFSNIEHLAIEFVYLTLMPWLKRWEENLWRCVLTNDEKSAGYYFKHNVNALLRGDFLTRMQGYATALQNGWLNQNEVRELEDLDGFEGGDDYHIQLNMQSLPGGTPTSSQQASIQKLGTAATKGRMIQ